MTHQVRVIFGDTDQLGVVYYANYLRYFEGARASLLRSWGRVQSDLERWSVALPVVEAHVNYRRFARYEDVLDIDVVVTEVHGASVVFAYEVARGGEVVADGITRHCCVSAAMRPTRFPGDLRELLVAARDSG
jgi:acyl-CoA thioester hydrolase